MLAAFVILSSGGAAIFSPDAHAADLFVSDNFGHQVIRYNNTTGALLGTFVTSGSGGLSGATGLLATRDALWVTSQNTNQILRYDLGTGAFVNVFASNAATPGTALAGPSDLLIRDNGLLYVSNFGGTTVDRFDLMTGASLGAFTNDSAAPAADKLNGASSMAWGPDNNLYVSSFNTNKILRFNGNTGEFMNVFASGGGLNGPAGLTFQGGQLYVSSLLSQKVLRYNGTTGAFVDVFASPPPVPDPFPSDLMFRPDGTLLVALTGQQSVAQFSSTGAFTGTFAAGGGLIVPSQLLVATVNPLWQGAANANWSAAASWTNGVAPNSATAVAEFADAPGDGSPANLNANHTVNKIVFASNDNYTLSSTNNSKLTLAGDAPGIRTGINNGGGVETVAVSLDIGTRALIETYGGTLKFALPANATSTVAPAVTTIIGTNAVLELSGPVSALGSLAGAQTEIITRGPTSILRVTGTNQVVGHVAGTASLNNFFGTQLGQTVLSAGSDLAVLGLRQNQLTLAAGNAVTPTKLLAQEAFGLGPGLIVLDNTAANNGSGTPGLVMGNDSVLDVFDNDAVIYYAGNGGDPNPTAAIQGYINNFYNSVTGVPVVASQGIINTGGETVFVAIDNGVTGFGDRQAGPFYDLILGDSATNTGFNQTLVIYTFAGDYDLNGVVDALDYSIVDANLGSNLGGGGVGGWQRGDGDFDGMVTPLDYAPIDANLGKGSAGAAPLASAAAIPEPSLILVGSLAAAGCGLIGLRRRRSRG